MRRLEGKTAIVTGAGRGIGRGIAVAFGREGANVVVASRTKSTVDSAVSEIEAEGGTAIGVACDVGRRDDVFAMVAKAASAFGRIDILVNNAQGFGTAERPAPTPRLTPLEDFDEEEWECTFRTAALATLWGMKAVFPWMKERGGKIINLGSSLGQIGGEGTAAYNATEGSHSRPQPYGRTGVGKVRDQRQRHQPGGRHGRDARISQRSSRAGGGHARPGAPSPLGGPRQGCRRPRRFLASSDADYLTGMTLQLDGGGSMHA